ncbi:MAG: ATP-dependent sacrificial sulfur transferase LarE [Saprospiraceae bacterium]|nr:ATP-dependent sacrificial sulfur transferase LarE [Saprospiraceae bacterium]
MPKMIAKKIDALKEWFENHPGTITAFSGGIDSALVLFLSHHFLDNRALGCISISPSLKRKDYAEAIEFCEKYGIHLEIIETREIEDANYLANPSNRCYYCKSHLYTDLTQVKKMYPGYSLLNGTNLDDFQDYRPGLKAATEHEILSPLADCHLTKEDVRALAKHFGLPNWNKPASPCLSSRVPYGEFITPYKLKQIEDAESILNDLGFDEVRVRHYGSEAKIEVPPSELDRLKSCQSEILDAFKAIGFETCRVDEEGLVSGKLNRVLENTVRAS